MLKCLQCRLRGYCLNIRTVLVSDTELDNPEFIRAVRATALQEGVDAAEWCDHLADLYRDYRGWIAASPNNPAKASEVLLNLEVFEAPSIREWFRDFCCTPCPDDVTPRLRSEARERVRVLATILRATYPVKASLWGVLAANDDRPPRG